MTIDKRQAAAYEIPCAIPILELMHQTRFQEDPRWIRDRLAIRTTLREIRRALLVLEQTGLATRDDDGALVPTALQRQTRQPAPRKVRAFHRAMLQHAADSLEALPPSRRHVSSLTTALTDAQYRSLCQRVDRLRADIQRWSAQPARTNKKRRVHCVGFQIVPLTDEGGNS